MTDAASSLQQGIYQTLTGTSTVTDLLGGPNVFDHVPGSAKFPYLTIGETIMRDWSSGTEDGHEHIVTLHVWSRAGGQKEALEISGAVSDALRDTPIPLNGHQLVNLRYEFSQTRRDPDGETYHGLVRFRAVTETQTV